MRVVQTSLMRRRLWVIAAIVGLLAVAACDQTGRFATPGDASGSHALKPVSLSVDGPANGSTNVSPSVEFPITTTGKIAKTELVSSEGNSVSGSFLRGDSTWVPEKQLAYSTSYTLKVSAKNGSLTKSYSSHFKTMSRPSRTIETTLYVTNGQEVGVGLPIVIKFDGDISDEKKADVERRLFVRSDPQVEGSWNWFSDSEVHYRPKEYWKPGTKISVRAGIGGLDMGGGYYGNADRVFHLTVGSETISKVSNSDKKIRVYQDGKLVKEFPVSLGAAATPTSSGTLVAMDKAPSMIFDSSTFGVPSNAPGGYRETVYWDVRFTWGGEFVHAAPWSTGQQGSVNVSHGCVNLATENAKWFYEMSKMGDVIDIEGTEANVKAGDGWTDWTMSWDDYQKGSALYQQKQNSHPDQ